jgi:hypothetical protein
MFAVSVNSLIEIVAIWHLPPLIEYYQRQFP